MISVKFRECSHFEPPEHNWCPTNWLRTSAKVKLWPTAAVLMMPSTRLMPSSILVRDSSLRPMQTGRRQVVEDRVVEHHHLGVRGVAANTGVGRVQQPWQLGSGPCSRQPGPRPRSLSVPSRTQVSMMLENPTSLPPMVMLTRPVEEQGRQLVGVDIGRLGPGAGDRDIRARVVGVVVQRRVGVRAAIARATGADVAAGADAGGVRVAQGDIAAGGGIGAGPGRSARARATRWPSRPERAGNGSEHGGPSSVGGMVTHM